MNREKFLQQSLPFQGIHAPYHKKGHLLYSSDTPSGIVHSAMLVRLALMDCESDNPFQELGLAPDIFFSVNNGEAPMVHKAIADVFQEFDDRFRLIDVSTESEPDAGRVSVSAAAEYLPFGQTVTLADLLPVDLVR